MDLSFELIKGDTPGVEWRFPVFRFRPEGPPSGPSVYMQAGLHAGELPGPGALHLLVGALREASAEGRLRSDITLVPSANPIGLGQELFGNLQGRFDIATRTNFNRDFPLPGRPMPAHRAQGAVARLKERLLQLSAGADIVLDLHCDDVSLQYIYASAALWPAMQDLAQALDCAAALIWSDDSDGAFEEAALARVLQLSPEDLAGKVVSTVELRGLGDVSAALAEKDAGGLMRFLEGRGALAGPWRADKTWTGLAVPLQNIEMIRAPVSGCVWFDVAPGDEVEAGQRLARILHAPGEENGVSEVCAPQAGTVITRVSQQLVRPGGDLIKLACAAPSASFKPGALES